MTNIKKEGLQKGQTAWVYATRSYNKEDRIKEGKILGIGEEYISVELENKEIILFNIKDYKQCYIGIGGPNYILYDSKEELEHDLYIKSLRTYVSSFCNKQHQKRVVIPPNDLMVLKQIIGKHEDEQADVLNKLNEYILSFSFDDLKFIKEMLEKYEVEEKRINTKEKDTYDDLISRKALLEELKSLSGSSISEIRYIVEELPNAYEGRVIILPACFNQTVYCILNDCQAGKTREECQYNDCDSCPESQRFGIYERPFDRILFDKWLTHHDEARIYADRCEADRELEKLLKLKESGVWIDTPD